MSFAAKSAQFATKSAAESAALSAKKDRLLNSPVVEPRGAPRAVRRPPDKAQGGRARVHAIAGEPGASGKSRRSYHSMSTAGLKIRPKRIWFGRSQFGPYASVTSRMVFSLNRFAMSSITRTPMPPVNR